MAEPWDIPNPLPIKGARSAEPIFQAVGKALSHWELVEQALAQLFSFITTGEAINFDAPSIRAFGSVIGTRARIGMVRAATDSWFLKTSGCPHAKECSALLTRCERWAARRNDIAHGRASLYYDERTGAEGWLLYPGLYNTGKYPLGGKPRYTYAIEDMDRYAEGFVEMWKELTIITARMHVWSERDREGLPQNSATMGTS